MTTKEAWIHPNPVMGGIVILPDGYEMRRHAAEAKGYKVVAWPDSERTAVPHPHEKDLVILPRGQVLSRNTANIEGFALAARLPNAAAADPNRSWRAAIMGLPEARDRTSATAELLTTQSHETLSVEAARAFLRGLPTEDENEEQTTVTDNADPRAARLAEIEGSVAAFNKSQGYRTARSVAPRPVQERTDIEPTKLQRLTEIRLMGLCQNGRDNSQEAKILRNALDTHHRVGTPLNRALAQHGLDATTLLPKI
jgi:hypothetical protein